jgi:alpha-tubulin suppressor-like RCC1 family protein
MKCLRATSKISIINVIADPDTIRATSSILEFIRRNGLEFRKIMRANNTYVGITADKPSLKIWHILRRELVTLYKIGNYEETPLEISTSKKYIFVLTDKQHIFAIRTDAVVPGMKVDDTAMINIHHVKQMSSIEADEYSLFTILEDGRVFGVGFNSHYQLGIEDTKYMKHNQPVEIDRFRDAKAVIAGHHFSVGVFDHKLMACGTNDCYQCAQSTSRNVIALPLRCTFLRQVFSKIRKTIMIKDHIIVLSTQGEVFLTGTKNTFGEHGFIGSVCNTVTKVQIPYIQKEEKIIDIYGSANLYHYYAVSNSTIYCFGKNNSGQLGVKGANIHKTSLYVGKEMYPSLLVLGSLTFMTCRDIPLYLKKNMKKIIVSSMCRKENNELSKNYVADQPYKRRKIEELDQAFFSDLNIIFRM